VRDAAVQAAIEAAGGLRSLARGIGISSPSIVQWKCIPAGRVVQIERLTGIPREALRPDLYEKGPREKKEASVRGNDDIIETWFRLLDGMLTKAKTPTGARPPSLRDACYAVALSRRTAGTDTSPETIEAYVNGLELGALHALREAWDLAYQRDQLANAPEDHGEH
jgi:DNA-binding transcriptional regulator YdaS (Cro superfamily)